MHWPRSQRIPWQRCGLEQRENALHVQPAHLAVYRVAMPIAKRGRSAETSAQSGEIHSFQVEFPAAQCDMRDLAFHQGAIAGVRIIAGKAQYGYVDARGAASDGPVGAEPGEAQVGIPVFYA